MKRSFASLSPQEALHVAVFIEERNAELYHRFAEMFVEFRDVESLEIASVFWDMAVEERHHSTLLQERYTERFGSAACSMTEEDLQELIEVPRLEDGDVFNAAAAASGGTPQERALQVALSAELNAQKFYADLVSITTDPRMKKFYGELSEFESDHITFLEKKIHESPAKEKGGPA